MTARCHEPAELAILAALPKGDPRRRHLDGCPRCQALSLSYSEFVHDRSVPEGADLPDAEARLANAFTREQARGQPPHAGDPDRREGSPLPARKRPFRWPPLSGRRPAFALAVVVMLAGLAYLGREWRLGGHGADTLRGGSSARSSGTTESIRQAVRLLPAERDPENHPVLRWRSQPGADGYQVRLFGADLVDFARIGPQTDTLLVLAPGVLPPGAPSTGEIGWQIIALRQGRSIASSPPATVRLD